jgi:hypothetical protein
MINHLEVALPFILVVIAFLLKVFMDRSVTVPVLLRSLYELPVDIVFLAISFSIAATISQSEKREEGLLLSFVFLVAVLLSVVAWRRSILLFEINHKKWSIVIFLINFLGASYCLIKGISILVGVTS